MPPVHGPSCLVEPWLEIPTAKSRDSLRDRREVSSVSSPLMALANLDWVFATLDALRRFRDQKP